jgi:hypothetical protein
MCSVGIFGPKLVYETPQGEKKLMIPKTEFTQEIKKLLMEAKHAEHAHTLRECLVKVFQLVNIFNSIYHHLTNGESAPAIWAGKLPAGSEPFHSFEMYNFDEYMADKDTPHISVTQPVQRLLMDDTFRSDRGSQTWFEQLPTQLERLREAYQASLRLDEEQQHIVVDDTQLPPGIPSQGRQPQSGSRSTRQQSGASTFRIGERDNRPAFLVKCDGEEFEVLWYQILRTRTGKEQGGRLILAQAREDQEDYHTTRPLSRFPGDTRTEFQRFCLENEREPEFITGTFRTRKDEENLWKQTEFLANHPIDDWLIIATFHVPGKGTKRTETAYTLLRFRSEVSATHNTIFDTWKFSNSELRKAYDTNRSKLVDEKLAAFRVEHGLQEPARGGSDRSSSGSRSRSRSQTPPTAAANEHGSNNQISNPRHTAQPMNIDELQRQVAEMNRLLMQLRQSEDP